MLLATLLLTATGSAFADDKEAPESKAAATLQPYQAEYTTTARGMTVTLERELKTDGEGGYTLTNGGTLLVVGFHEVAVFAVNDAQVRPRSYIYQGTGLINRRSEVHFTPGADTVRSLYKEEWYELPYTEGTLDRMSQQEQLRLDLMSKDNPRENISVRIADGKRVRDYELVYVGDEVLETPLGPVNALHFERLHDDPDRESDIWFAPAWDYLMVKTVHIEDDKPVEVLLANARIGGAQVVAATDKH
jgi:hypothetical protein